MTNLPVRASAGLPAGPRSFDEMYRQAEVLAKSDLVPKALQGKPESIVLVGLYGAEHGISLVTALSQVHIIDNKPSPSAQLQLGQAARLGHETRWVETSSEKAVLRARRREDRNNPDGWVTFTFTLDDARKAGLLDQYVEHWQKDGRYDRKFTWTVGDDQGMRDLTGAPDWVAAAVKAGKVKRRDPWFKYTEDMLCARVATRAAKRMFPDALLALDADPYSPEIDVDPDTGEVLGRSGGDPPEDPQREDGDAEEVDDAVVVEDLAQGPEPTRPAQSQAPAPAEDTVATPPPVPFPELREGERADIAALKTRIRDGMTPKGWAGLILWLEACGIPVTLDGVTRARVGAVEAELNLRGVAKLAVPDDVPPPPPIPGRTDE